MGDLLFDTLTRLHGARPWGAVLDAGTGSHSLRWIAGLETTRWTAVTGDVARERAMKHELRDRIRPQDRVVTGNWTDPTLLQGEVYEVVLADYLLGAIDGFAPYFQDRLFARLRPLVGEVLYGVGLAPYPDLGETPGGRVILEIARLRDACILLASHRCYREYPLDWVIRSLERSGFRVEEAISFPIVYRERFINGQLDVCTRKLPFFQDPNLAKAMERSIEELRERALKICALEGGIRFGEDWVFEARPV